MVTGDRYPLSLEFELAVHPMPLVRSDEALVAEPDGMKRAVETFLPKLEELVHLGEVGGEVVFLPDIGL
jgi:hypothetical protein